MWHFDKCRLRQACAASFYLKAQTGNPGNTPTFLAIIISELSVL